MRRSCAASFANAAPQAQSEKLPQGQQVERHAAELEREIPPVIPAAAQDKSQCELFPYLAAEHEDAAY